MATMMGLRMARWRAPAALRQGQLFLARHWLAMANGYFLLAAAGSALPPALLAVGLAGPGARLFGYYHLVCTQQAEHSFFLWGTQMALCQRDLALYGATGLAGLLFGVSGRGWSPLHWRRYLLLVAPMALDGGTQLLGMRESTWALRLLTGALFGLATVWIAYPHLQDWARRVLAEGEHRGKPAAPSVHPLGDEVDRCQCAQTARHTGHSANRKDPRDKP